jgi:5-methylcytosine-specific restriction endonuclease McrA
MKTPCRYPGCAALLDRAGFCERHAVHARQPRRDYETRRLSDPVLAAAKRFRSSRAWQACQRLKLRTDPLCEDPYGAHRARGDTRSALQVHHIKPLATHPELGLRMDNLMSVCTGCHSRLEAEVRRGTTGS